jgi:hypothetical protein
MRMHGWTAPTSSPSKEPMGISTVSLLPWQKGMPDRSSIRAMDVRCQRTGVAWRTASPPGQANPNVGLLNKLHTAREPQNFSATQTSRVERG